jgi:hypothetical protein
MTKLSKQHTYTTARSLKAKTGDGRKTCTPLENLVACKEQWSKNELGYRKKKYELIGEVYGHAILMLNKEVEASKFYALPYWRGPRLRKARTTRDLFRDVFEFILDAKSTNEQKAASKYAGVLAELYRAEVPPENAAARIAYDGGIEQIHRQGLGTRIAPAAADVGDGMDLRGRKVHYHEDHIEDSHEEPGVLFDNLRLLSGYEPKDLDDVVVIEASWRSTGGGYLYKLERVTSRTRQETASGSSRLLMLPPPELPSKPKETLHGWSEEYTPNAGLPNNARGSSVGSERITKKPKVLVVKSPKKKMSSVYVARGRRP